MIAELGTLVIALGGNAIARSGDDGSLEAQYVRAREAMASVADLLCAGAHIVITHGNGPVVGNIVLRCELASDHVPPMPLYIAGADSEGGIGLMLQQTLGNELRRRDCPHPVAAIVTQVVVDEADPAFERPTKPIGGYYTDADADRLRSEAGWSMARQHDGRYRRVVPSPRPKRVVEVEAVQAMMAAGVIPITAGGGGVPVTEDADGMYAGCDAVIDKDWTSAVLAHQLDAARLYILMETDAVYLDWGTPEQRALESITPDEADHLVASGQLAEGSIAPKVAAAAWFARTTGRRATLCRTEDLLAAVEGRCGTRIEG